jgi:hypothetical protein
MSSGNETGIRAKMKFQSEAAARGVPLLDGAVHVQYDGRQMDFSSALKFLGVIRYD